MTLNTNRDADDGRFAAIAEIPPPPGGGLLGISWLNHDLSWLFVLRVLRSIAQGCLGIILPLYLAALGYGPTALGVLLAFSAITAAGISTTTGVLADRFGRKAFLIIISIMMAIGGIGFGLSTTFTMIVVFASIGSIGRGGALAGGAWGPFYPAVQALVAEHASDYSRTTVFGAFSFVGVMAGAVGALIAGLPSLLKHMASVPELHTYRALFVAAGGLGIAMAFAVIPINERPLPDLKLPERSEIGEPGESTSSAASLKFGLSPESWHLVVRFMITNATNGLAIGMLGPFAIYWFYRRFGVNAGELAEVFFVINLITSVPYLMAGRIALKLGTVRSVVLTRAVGAVLLLGVVMMPTFLMAAGLYAVRALFNVLSIPVRQSYLMGVIPPAERSSASGFASFPSQVMSAAGPYMAGIFMEHLFLSLPLEFAAVMQGINTALYWIFFRNVYPPEEMEGSAGR